MYLLLILSFAFVIIVNNQEESNSDLLKDYGLDDTAKCIVTDSAPVKVSYNTLFQASPSLSKCFSYNSLSCCTSVHDSYITEKISAFLTKSCESKFPQIRDIMCMLCNPYQPYFYNITNTSTPKLKVCKSFVRYIWGNTEDNLTKYDIAGVSLKLNQPLQPTKFYDTCGFINSQSDGYGYYIKPSSEYANPVDFLQRLGIPFLDEKTEIEIIEDEANADSMDSVESYKLCFKSTGYVDFSTILLIIITAIIIY